ncbi:MAG: thiol:disulfide interchange protein DsbA/DsbL [Burkholderiales bacterium]
MLARLFIAATLMACSITAVAQQPVEGKDFYEIKPAHTTDAAGKIEVLEFFWYGCPHCHNLEPAIEAWLKKLPADVVFRRVPAVFNQNWEAAARVYYTLDAMGQLDRLHKVFFDSIHNDSLRYTNQGQFDAWLTKNGIALDKYTTTSKSFTVESKVRRATQLTNEYKFDGVPALVVQGRFVVGAQTSPAQQLQNVDFFIAQVRAEQKK